MSLLIVSQLTKIFQPKRALGRQLFRSKPPFVAVNHISFELRRGEILGLLGPNGAGKTTTIQMLLGTLIPTSGSIHYFGYNLATHRSAILQQVSHASAYTKLPGSLTIQENLEIYARLYGISSSVERKERIGKLMESFGIASLKDQFVHGLSAGQLTRVMLVKAFLSHPKIVLLDEPTASLDPDIAKETRNFILQQQQEFGVSIILTSHNMQEVSEVCNRVLVLQNGQIIEEDSPENLAKKVSLSQLELTLPVCPDTLHHYLKQNQYAYTVKGHLLTIETEENHIAPLLRELAKLDVHYTHIEIRKPSLEDYFVYVSRKPHSS